jgi:hypothetical protein
VFAGSVSAGVFDMAFWAQPQYWTLSIIKKSDHTAGASWLEKIMCAKIRTKFSKFPISLFQGVAKSRSNRIPRSQEG